MALVSRAAAPLGSFKKTGAVRFAAELGLILVAVRAIARTQNCSSRCRSKNCAATQICQGPLLATNVPFLRSYEVPGVSVLAV